MTQLKRGQHVKHHSVSVVMTVNEKAVICAAKHMSNHSTHIAGKADYTNCRYSLNGKDIQKDFPTNELVLVK